MEESPESGTVEEEVRAAVNVLGQTHAAGLVAATAPGEVWVAVLAVRCPRSWGILLRASALPVCGFSLLHTRVHILRVVQVVVVERVVFEGGAGEPGSFCGFDEQAAACGDVLMTAALERVVGGPAPYVFYVGGRGGCEMYHCESGLTVCCIAGAAGGIDVGVRCAAHSYVRVPDSDIARFRASHIYLQDDSTRRDISDGKSHILNLGYADIACVADLYDRLWVVRVTESAADARYHGPGFSHDASSGWDQESGLDNIDAVRKVGDLAVGSVDG